MGLGVGGGWGGVGVGGWGVGGVGGFGGKGEGGEAKYWVVEVQSYVYQSLSTKKDGIIMCF